MTNVLCPSCGIEIIKGETDVLFCPECGKALASDEPAPDNQQALAEDMAGEIEPVSVTPVCYKMEFVGTASEYFRIFIVNVFLTVITLGFYSPWAKVRTRSYFYSHSLLAGEPFSYLANPVAILKGYLIVGGGFLIFQLTGRFYPLLAFPVILGFFAIFPFLMYKSLRFKAHNSAWRNIRLRFQGKLKESYVVFLAIPLLTPFTLGILWPYFHFRQKKYYFDNMGFGTTKNEYSGRPGPFYKYMVLSILFTFFALVLSGVVIGILVYIVRLIVGDSFDYNEMRPVLFLFIPVFYLLFFSLFFFIEQYRYVRLTNYSWVHSNLGEVRFESTLKIWQMFWIRLSNIIAILFTIGLLIPWAKVRRMRYVLDNLTLVTSQGLDDFIAAVEPEESALGDSAMDFFDFEIGL